MYGGWPFIQPNGICHYFVPRFYHERAFSLTFLLVDACMMLPIIGFFLVDDPHDCYTCLGKDPDRIYSSF